MNNAVNLKSQVDPISPLFYLLAYTITSIVLSGVYFSIQSYPTLNSIWGTFLNLLVFNSVGILGWYITKKQNNKLLFSVISSSILTFLTFTSTINIGAKVSWGQFLNTTLFYEILINLEDFIPQTRSLFYLFIFTVVVYSLLVGYYFYRIFSKRSASKLILLLYVASIFCLIPVSIIPRAYIALKNHIFQNDHQATFWINSFTGGSKSNENKISKSNITEYDSKFANQRIKPRVNKNIVLILVDALRADKIGEKRDGISLTPFIDSLILHDNLVEVDKVYSTCGNSECGILSTLASKRFEDIGYFNYLIQDHLKKAGYKNHMILSGMHSSWYNIGKQYMSNVDVYYEGKDSDQFKINDDRMINEFLEKVIPDLSAKNFFYLHLMSTHFFGLKDPNNEIFKPKNGNLFTTYEERKIAYINNYDNGVINADHIIKKAYQQFEKAGQLDNTIFIISADHGELLGENNKLGHTNSLHEKELHIPLLIYGMDSTIQVNRGELHSSQTDIAPTICDILGLPIPRFWQGTSILKKTSSYTSYHKEGKYIKEIVSDSTGKTDIIEYLQNKE